MKKTSHTSHRRLTKKSLVAALGALALLATSTTFAAAAEQLEKGIYAEETKGDLEGAMRIYEQILADAKTNRAAAAQAQYRLGLCLLKKKDDAGARAAFEKVIKEFSDQTDVVAKAQPYVQNNVQLLPVPWSDGEVLQYVFKLPGGMEIGTAAYMANLVEGDGRKMWQIGTRSLGGTQAVSRVLVDGETFRPVRSRWNVFILGSSEAEYGVGQVEIKTKGKDDPKIVKLDEAVFDNEQAVHLMRRLPLAVGYKTRLPILPILGGQTTMHIDLEVKVQENVVVPAGTYDCFKAEMSIGQTFWITNDEHRYIAKFEAGGAIAELTQIKQGTGGDQVALSEALGTSFRAPAGSVVYQPKSKKEGKSTVLVLDRNSLSMTTVDTTRIADIPANIKASPRAWADSGIKEASELYKDVVVRPNSWQNRTVAGRPGLSVIADYVDQSRKMVFYGTCVISGMSGSTITGRCEPEEFDEYKKQVDAIIASYQAK